MKPSGHKPYWLRVSDVQGSYTIPYIQSHRDLSFRVDFEAFPDETANVLLALELSGQRVAQRIATRLAPEVVFEDLCSSEYALTTTGMDASNEAVCTAAYRSIGVGGAVVAALGDSLTEGYHSHGFMRPLLDLLPGDFPPDAVSADGRNFPQFSPTTHHHKPSVNCFQSWMTRLNNRLTKDWQRPVFIANEGWGGYTAGNYLAMMERNLGGWSDRMHQLRPSTWLIHLGVNDERHGVSAAEFGSNMRKIVELLRRDYGAVAETIYIARPSYDYAPGAEPVLRGYIAEIDALVKSLGLQSGPDFFAAFADDKKKWYGNDPVHPGPEGMDLMADLWLEKLGENPPSPPGMSSAPVLVVPSQILCPEEGNP